MEMGTTGNCRRTPPLWIRALMVSIFALIGYAAAADTAYEPVIYVEGRDIQSVINEAPPYATVVCDFEERVIDEGGTIVIDKPLKLVNLRARLADHAKRTEIVLVMAKDVVITDFRLYGNKGTVEHADRASLILIGEDNFRVENGFVADAMRHGIEVRPDLKGEQLYDGAVRNIVSEGIRRDTVSINGDGRNYLYNHNILVENIWGYGNEDRGPVEVVDGNRNVNVRNVYAEDCEYGVEIHDHAGGPGESQEDIIVEGVYVMNTRQAVSSRQQDYNHINLTIRDVSGDNWPPTNRRARVDVAYFDNVRLENIRINNNTGAVGVSVRQSKGVMLRDIFVHNHGEAEESIEPRVLQGFLDAAFGGAAEAPPAVEIVDCSDVLVDGVLVRGDIARGSTPLSYRLTGDWGSHRNLQIHNVSAPGAVGILLEREDENVSLENYMVSGNLARVQDEIAGEGAMISNNME